ncbi:hypothetical protein AAW14_37210 [Streptomyces hygroscopicus]|uniref:hypothetical protein n=1 Tax=Streptomyces hygroscopicus TaxID=1912 RepID=UPI002240ABEA|nr:hypothetical protein [Streptomyces hygroscopicus]MCW7947417.1 hypothetical protein [Streptomyces hygroscopicus]
MLSAEAYGEELDYLVNYARESLVYFDIVRDAAENIAGSGSTESQIQQATLKLISDMIERGVKVGDPSSNSDEDLTPWNMPKGEVLNRITKEMAMRDDPSDFIDICWFRSG